MSKDDVVKKVLEIVKNLDKKARILLQIIVFHLYSELNQLCSQAKLVKLPETLMPSETSIAAITCHIDEVSSSLT